MIEQDAIGGVEPVSLSVVDGSLELERLGHGVWGKRVEWSLFGLGRRSVGTEQF